MTREALLSTERENVIQVYTALALQMPSTHRLRQPHCEGCVSLSPYSFCNFVLGLTAADERLMDRGVHHLVELARNRPLLRVIAMSGDQPWDWSDALKRAGFRSSHHLVKMAGSGGSTVAENVGIREATTPHERALVADFMVRQFFSMNERHFQAAVARATRSVDYSLVALWRGEKPIATMMLAESAQALGLYNLTVAGSERRRGVGTEMVRAAQARARSAQKPLILQCDANLVGWYSRLGLVAVGEMQSFHYHR